MKKLMILVVMVAAFALPTMAQNQEWQSTSTLQGTGSNYAPQVTAVGATAVSSLATTTEIYSPAKAPGGPRKGFDTGAETGQSDEFPIGDAVLPMLIMAMLFAGVVYTRRKKALNR